MATVIHALPEEDEAGREMHLRYWYGTVPPSEEYSDDEDDNAVVCWCGAHHVQLREDVIAVWHIQSWHSRGGR